jgi:thiol-disulfide isomerase/thioredoxin
MTKYLKLMILTAALGLYSCSGNDNPTPEKQEAAAPKVEQTANVEQPKEAPVNKNVKLAEIKTVEAATNSKLVADFTFELNGKEMKFSEYAKGKKVLLNFWGTWCPPCRAELPDLVKISNENLDKDWLVVGISLEQKPLQAQKVEVKDFLAAHNIEYLDIIGSREGEDRN